MTEHAEKTAPVQEQLPINIDVRIQSVRASGSVLAHASITLNGCFAIRGLRVVQGENGPFVSMPSYKSGGEYRDVCFPITKDFREQMHTAVLGAYQQELVQLTQRRQETQGQEPQAAPFPQQVQTM